MKDLENICCIRYLNQIFVLLKAASRYIDVECLSRLLIATRTRSIYLKSGQTFIFMTVMMLKLIKSN